jgi:nucleotide-binding universal stress UspA family protein
MYSRVLVAYDGTGCAELALREAIRMAEEGAHLIVLAVADSQALPVRVAKGEGVDSGQAGFAAVERSRAVLELAGRQLAARNLKSDTLLVDLTESGEHNVARTILNEARSANADLIVMGTHGRHGFKRFLLGSVAERVVRESSCPVLLVRGDSPSAISCVNPSEIYGQWPEDERIGH